MAEQNEAVIVAATRSPIGRANKGSLVDKRADEMMGDILNAVMEKVPQIQREDVQDVIIGNVAQAGETGFNIARTANILAGWPHSVPGHTVQRFCASSLQALSTAANSIKVGEGDIYVAGGVEKSSRPPAPEGGGGGGGGGGGRGIGPGGLNPRLLPGNEEGFPFVYIPMGLTAENVADKYGVKREDMDAFAALSQQRAVAAQENGIYDWEISPITKEDGTVVTKDDGPRAGTTKEKLAELKPVFKEDGTVTAGNACPLNDGAVRRGRHQPCQGRRARPQAARAGRRHRLLGQQPRDHGRRSHRGHHQAPRHDRHEDRRHRLRRAQRGVRRTGPADLRGHRHRHREAAEPPWRRHRPGSPVRQHRHPHHDHADQRPHLRGRQYGIETMCAAGGMAMATLIERV